MFINKFEKCKNIKERKKLIKKSKIKEIKSLFQIEGIWTKNILFDGKIYFDFTKLKKYKPVS